MTQPILLRGPDDVQFVIEPYSDGYMSRFRNSGSKAAERFRLDIIGVWRFSAEKQDFREIQVSFAALWIPERELQIDGETKNVPFVTIEGDRVRLGQTGGSNWLPWPDYDHSTTRRWLLSMKVLGLSRDWAFQLDLQWKVGTTILELVEHTASASSELSNPFPAGDPRHPQWPVFLSTARQRLGQCVKDGVPDEPWIIRRLDTLADEGLGLFFENENNIESWKQVFQALYESASAAMGPQASETTRRELADRRSQWEKIIRRRAETADTPDRRWNIACQNQAVAALLCEQFERLAAHAAEIELQNTFKHRGQAVDAWLDFLQKESPYAHGWKVTLLLIASAEHCAELKIRALKAGSATKSEMFTEIERQFRGLASANPNADLYAVERGVDINSPEKETKLHAAAATAQTLKGEQWQQPDAGGPPGPGEPNQAAKGIDPFSDTSVRQPLGDENPFSTDDPRHQSFEQANWEAEKELADLKSKLLRGFQASSKLPSEVVQLLLTYRLARFDVLATNALKTVSSEETERGYEDWLGDFAEFERIDISAKLSLPTPGYPNGLAPYFDADEFTVILMQKVAEHIARALSIVAAQFKKTPSEPPRSEGAEQTSQSSSAEPSASIPKRRGRRRNDERRAAIHEEIAKHGDAWRDHTSEIFSELDRREVALGDFEGMEIDLDDGHCQKAWTWGDLDLAVGDQRRKILDALRKYAD